MMFGPYLSRQQALAVSARTYLGSDCKAGHGGVRLATKGSNCVTCDRLRRDKWQRENSGYFANYYAENAEALRARSVVNHHANREANNAARRARWAANPAKYAAVIAASRAKKPKHYQDMKTALFHKRRGAAGRFCQSDIDLIYLHQGGVCAYCPADLSAGYERDHIVPITLGGSNWPINIQLTCMPCNRRKGNKDPIDFAREVWPHLKLAA